MEKGNFVYSGWRANGFVALVGLLVLIAGGIALCVFGSDVMDPRIGLRTAMLVCGVCLFFISMFCFKGFMLLEPNEARVVMFFGKYKGTFYETGFWWINPFMGRKKISVRARNLNVEPIKVNDKNGNPVLEKAMSFSGPPPVYTPSFHTYVIRSWDGERYYKLQIISWYDANVQIGDEGGRISYYLDELK
jgi:hypothetical protein